MNSFLVKLFEQNNMIRAEAVPPLTSPAGMRLVARNSKMFHEERGWQLRGKVLHGWYRTRYGSFKGRIENPFSKVPKYFIIKPPAELLGGSHGACFTQIAKDVFSIHWAKKPDTIDTGIRRIEHTLYEGYHDR